MRPLEDHMPCIQDEKAYYKARLFVIEKRNHLLNKAVSYKNIGLKKREDAGCFKAEE